MKQNLSSDERKKILLDVADALEENVDLIRTENEIDVSAAQEAGYEPSLVARLTLKPGKVALVYISAYIITAIVY
jgi:delta-1-pyrroline-5-carboxylate synthetase